MGIRSTDEFDLPGISHLRYEPHSAKGLRTTIRFERATQPFGFGKDLDESAARWLIDLIQSRIDALN